MMKHIHFVLLVLGTVVFLMTVLRYSAPLVPPDHNYRNANAATLSYDQINDINLYVLHLTDMFKGSVKAFAVYLAFVAVISAHRMFYGGSRAFSL